ncbi:MAG: radical SAM protein [Planctomycetes bacterium]|nr:radical SAM protein [Planctomycetota bacterium]
MDTQFVPYVISWNLTSRCNLRCAHCYIDASQAMPGELSTTEALRVLDEIAEVNSETLLILTGGEPLLRPDLEELVARASSLGMMVVLGTNGTTLTTDRACALAERGLSGVGISLDSLIASRHDEFRGMAGAWDAAIRGVESARQAGLDVQIQMTLTRDNFRELPQVVRFSREFGARVLTVFFLVCTGRGQDLVDLTPEEYERILKWLAAVEQEGMMIRPRCAPTFRRILAQAKPDSILLQSDAGRCLAAKNYCRITPDGKVTPCPYMPLVAGSLREDSFAAIWKKAPLFESLRNPALQGRCGDCEYKELCGGCRARAYAAVGDPLAEDPWCTYVPGTDPSPPPSADPSAERQETAVTWTPEAEARLKKVPFFVRRMVRSGVEAFARRQEANLITPELMGEARGRMVDR